MSTHSPTLLACALVLKHRPIGEKDRLVTLVCQEKGKITCVAKGVRQMKSSKKCCLESGNLSKVYLIEKKSSQFTNQNQGNQPLPLLTQAILTADCEPVRTDLKKIKQLIQFLEIVDRLFVEEELETSVFEEILLIRRMILSLNYSGQQIKTQISRLIDHLGFSEEENRLETKKAPSLTQQVAELTGQKMYGYNYLTP